MLPGRGRKSTWKQAPVGSWMGYDKAIFTPDDNVICVKYYEPVSGASTLRFAFPKPRAQIVWVHARLVRKIDVKFSASPIRRTRRSGLNRLNDNGIKYLSPEDRMACIAACGK